MADYTTPDENNERLLRRIQEQHDEALIIEAAHNIGRITGQGDVDAKWQHLLGGLNRLPNAPAIPVHKEMQGLTLFTRPELNLSMDNISNLRLMSHLLSTARDSPQHAVRRILDPRVQREDGSGDESRLVDPYTPYISLLSNTLQSMSQPPDIGTATYASPEGIVKEQWIMNEGIAFMNGRYDLTCVFNNVKGAMNLTLFHAWILYQSYLRIGLDGGLVPYPNASFYGVMDYFTRIERFKFDETGRYVVQWFHTGAAFPTNISIGAGFSFDRDEAYDKENRQLSVQFSCVGAVYQDPIQLLEFNMRHERLNPNFRTGPRQQMFTRVDYQDIPEFNYVGYPRINLATHEMEWWVPNEVHDRIINKRDPLARSYGTPEATRLSPATKASPFSQLA